MKTRTASLLSIVIAITFSVVVPAGLIFYVDPFQIYHKTFFKDARYSQKQGHQHAGWINRLLSDPAQGYQSIVIGSSTVANYTQARFNESLPGWGKILNLSINGSVPKTQVAVARYALSKNPAIKHVLWDIHFYYVIDVNDSQSFPFYLYNDNISDDGGYLLNVTNLLAAIQFFRGDFSGFVYGIEDNGPWYEGLLAAGRFEVFKSVELRKSYLAKLQANGPLAQQSSDVVAGFSYPEVEKNLLDVVMPFCNKDTEFTIMFSPHTRYYYASEANLRHVYSQLYMRRYILERTSACKNIKIFVFDDVDWIAGDMTNYADNMHYKAVVNTYVLESIAKERHRLTAENVAGYEQRFIDAVNGYEAQYTKELIDMEREAAQKVGSQ